MIFWVARWMTGDREVDVVMEQPDIEAAMEEITKIIKLSGLVPTSPVALAPLQPYMVNVEQFSRTSAKN